MPRRVRIVTLTTDVGPAYAAQMKAVLYRALPPGHVVDLVDDLPAHRIEEAAFLLEHLAIGFPAGTVHVAVVDPGVGGSRAPLAVRCRDGSFLVGPDNGLLAPLARRLGVASCVRLRPEQTVPGRTVSATFEGRDLFAPAAARLATGARLASLGVPAPLHDYEVPGPVLGRRSARGVVLHIDRFGNAITNVPSGWASDGERIRVDVGRRRLSMFRRRTYGDLPRSGLGLIGSSFGVLELCAREARAADRLRLHVGDRLRLTKGASSARDGKYRRP